MHPHLSCQRIVCAAILLLLPAVGCRSTSSTPGDHLPVVPENSRALPGSVNSADAREAPRVQTNPHQLTTFRDPSLGLSFQYPSDWRPLVAGGAMDGPSFQEKLGPPSGSQAFLAAGTPLATTDLIGLSFSWAAKPGMDATTCSRMATDVLPMGTELPPESSRGAQFQRGMGGDSGMCHHTAALLDTTWHAGRCFFFERDLETSCPDIRTPEKDKQLTAEQRSHLQRQLDNVMASVSLR